MAAKKATTWVNYFEELGKREFQPGQLKVHGIEKLLALQKPAFNIIDHSIPLIYLLDYTSGRYAFFSKHCDEVLNFSSEKMIDGGINFVLERYHPDDLRLFNDQIFNDRLNMLKNIPVAQHKEHIFSLNYRVKNGRGDYVNLLQRNSFIQSDEKGNPLLSMGVITNINHFKTENPVIQLMEKVDAITGQVELIKKNTYYLREEDKIFSKREIEILSHLADGRTSKQIANKLFLSEHTIIQHKRNMQHKSNTENTTALVSFAFRQHLL